MITRRGILAACPGLVCGACAGHGPANPQTSLGGSDGPGPGPSDTDGPAPLPCLVTPGTEADGWFPIRLADAPELQSDGGFIFVDPDTRALIVARVADDCYVALDRRCTHAGFEIVLSYGRFVCTLHGSTFSTAGEVLGGPAPLDLVAYPVGFADETVWIGP